MQARPHKNVNKGIKAEGPLAEELVEYLLSIRPVNPSNAPIHFNPETGLPYVDIRKQWERLMVMPAACSATTSKTRNERSSTSGTPARLTSRSAAIRKPPHSKAALRAASLQAPLVALLP
jgi:hypothetical protein